MLESFWMSNPRRMRIIIVQNYLTWIWFLIVRGIRRSSSHVLSFGEQFIDPTPPPVVIIFPSITRVVILVLPLRLFLTLDEEDSICFAKLSLSKKHNNCYSNVISWFHFERVRCNLKLFHIPWKIAVFFLSNVTVFH